MKYKKLPVILLFVFFIVMGVVNNNRTSTSATSDKAHQRPEIPNKKQNQTERIPMNPSTSKKSRLDTRITPLEIQNFRGSLPTLENMKKEVQEAPHFTPKSLIKFAKQLGPLMDKALKNMTDAEFFSEELRDCAIDEAVVQSARATCVTSIERLAKRYPELNEMAEMIKANVAPDVRKLLKNRDKTLKR